jgi:hypothetical protein
MIWQIQIFLYRVFYKPLLSLISALIVLAGHLRCPGQGNEWYMKRRVTWALRVRMHLG